VIERRFRPRPPGVFAAYIALYCVGRFVMELLRIDPAHEIVGLRLNAWVSLLGVVVGVTWYVLSQRRGGPPKPRASKPPAPKRKMAVPGGRVRPPG
jgi:prolipoprotein diacylglyceryltransferase